MRKVVLMNVTIIIVTRIIKQNCINHINRSRRIWQPLVERVTQYIHSCDLFANCAIDRTMSHFCIFLLVDINGSLHMQRALH